VAHRISLSPYAMRIRLKRTKDYLKPATLPTGQSFLELLQTHFRKLNLKAAVDQDNLAAVKIKTCTTRPQSMSGLIQSGEYGIEAELQNLSTGKTRRREKDDCEFLPFFFHIQTHPRANEAILLMQRYGVYGVKTHFLQGVSEFVSAIDENWLLEVNPIATRQSIERALNGGIRKVIYIRHSVPADVADKLRLDGTLEEKDSMELVIKLKGHLAQIPKWMHRVARGYSDLDYLEVSGVTYDEMKVEAEIDGRSKMLNLAQLKDRLRMDIDITSDVDLGDDGHPEFESIRRIARRSLSELREALGWGDAEQD
jgi:hypothetical protein